jgi:general stress protein 26
VTDVHSAKHDEIDSAPNVGLVFIDPTDKAYLSITGRAHVIRDVGKTEMVWQRTDEVWWPDGPTDPDVCLLLIEPYRGIMGRAGEHCHCGLRVRQGEADR